MDSLFITSISQVQLVRGAETISIPTILASMHGDFQGNWRYFQSENIKITAFPAIVGSITQLIAKSKQSKAQV